MEQSMGQIVAIATNQIVMMFLLMAVATSSTGGASSLMRASRR